MQATPSPETIETDLRFAVFAAREAGRRAQGLREEKRWEGKMLADVGDQACDGYLRGILEGRYPDDGVLSEETTDSPERLGKSRSWIIDPLDGTKEYSQGRDDWAIHVALTVDQECSVSAVALPAENRVLWGVAVPGSERAGIEGGQNESLTKGAGDGPPIPRLVVSRSHTPEWVQRFAGEIGEHELLPVGSVGYKVSRLLLGHADIYVHKIGLKEWDTCAPETVARALGWTVCKLKGDEHRYNQADPYNHELVICRPSWKERVLEALAASGALEAEA